MYPVKALANDVRHRLANMDPVEIPFCMLLLCADLEYIKRRIIAGQSHRPDSPQM